MERMTGGCGREMWLGHKGSCAELCIKVRYLLKMLMVVHSPRDSAPRDLSGACDLHLVKTSAGIERDTALSCLLGYVSNCPMAWYPES